MTIVFMVYSESPNTPTWWKIVRKHYDSVCDAEAIAHSICCGVFDTDNLTFKMLRFE